MRIAETLLSAWAYVLSLCHLQLIEQLHLYLYLILIFLLLKLHHRLAAYLIVCQCSSYTTAYLVSTHHTGQAARQTPRSAAKSWSDRGLVCCTRPKRQCVSCHSQVLHFPSLCPAETDILHALLHLSPPVSCPVLLLPLTSQVAADPSYGTKKQSRAIY